MSDPNEENSSPATRVIEGGLYVQGATWGGYLGWGENGLAVGGFQQMSAGVGAYASSGWNYSFENGWSKTYNVGAGLAVPTGLAPFGAAGFYNFKDGTYTIQGGPGLADIFEIGIFSQLARQSMDWPTQPFSDPRSMSEIEGWGVEDPLCFPAHTPIAISTTETRPISDIRVGDTVLAFDPAADLGRGALVPRKVMRLYRNTTEEWVKLTWLEGGEAKELVATPGHHFLDSFGNFPTIEEMLENGKATVILASGELTEVTAERIVWSTQTAHIFEQAQSVGMAAGNAALKPAAFLSLGLH